MLMALKHMTMKFVSWQPGKIVFGTNSLSLIGEEVRRWGTKAILVTGRTFARKYGYTDYITKKLEEAGLKVTVFDKVEPNPSAETVDKGAKAVVEFGADVVVAFGGGSPMDAAKGIAVVSVLGGSAYDYFYPRVIEEEVLPVIAVPTTAGTGSEVTRYAVITDTKQNKKKVIVGYPIIPKTAILDPTVLKHMSPELTAWTGFDALSHAVEAYLSVKADPLSDIYAERAVRLIFDWLGDAVKGSLEAREKVYFASMLAGFAINHAGTMMVHGLGYYLTTKFNVHHGLANALLLPHALELISEKEPEKIERLGVMIGVGRSVEFFVRELKKLEDEVRIPKSIAEVGFKEENLDEAVKESLSYERNLQNTPIPINEKVVREVYRAALKGR